MKLKTKELTTCALFAALIAVGAFIKIDIPLPIYTMHFTLQWFFVLMAGLEPARRMAMEPKSIESTNSTTRAYLIFKKMVRMAGLEPARPYEH